MLKLLMISSTITFLISGCCPKPLPDIRYVDRNVTVNVPVDCIGDLKSDIKASDSIGEKLGKYFAFEYNVVNKCKKGAE